MYSTFGSPICPLLKNRRKQVEILILIIWKYKSWSWEKALMQIGCPLFGSFSLLKFHSSVLDRQVLYNLNKWKDSRAINVRTVNLCLTWEWKQHQQGDQISSCHTFVKKDRPDGKKVDIFCLSGKNLSNMRSPGITHPDNVPIPMHSGSRISQ